ncbi:MAG: hypothetical protein AAB131_03345 [Actinomycetota bacterium]|nr:MAG: hypothetical protein FD127_367 [Acidimicrobiaceae bacterium]
MAHYDTSPGSTVRRRPVLMAVAGAIGGLGLAMLLIHFARIALGTNAPLVVIVIGAAFGVALAYTLPAQPPRSSRRAEHAERTRT